MLIQGYNEFNELYCKTESLKIISNKDILDGLLDVKVEHWLSK
jgi:hypothetical protein